ncbi:cytochrome b [uncultured Amaricoccus sp.]|uniref:cytochrome b n=1 Tax=uncultured Amaricoccus sp. TaxID=339341 RepID=UPI002630182C|nr:cytochrome b [uncultured Amaricoccus sp.]
MGTPPNHAADGTGYGTVARVNHWVVALAMMAALGAGLGLEYLPLEPATRGWLMGWHKTIGVVVLVAGLWRLGWRLRTGVPAAVAETPSWQVRMASASHRALLAASILMPLSGIVMTVFRGRSVDLAGPFSIPAMGNIGWLAGGANTVHALVGTLLVALIGLHVAAALKHHFIDRDQTLRRMVRG